MKLERDFYLKNGIELAKSLLGKTLVHKTNEGVTKGIIVETEAYMGNKDMASHSYGNKRSKRTEIQYQEGGRPYIYMIYGMHYCINIVANKKEIPESVLIRAIEPIEGIELMKKRRHNNKLNLLCNGPGKLCQAFAITIKQYGIDLCGNELYLENSEIKNFGIEASKRINIDYSKEAKDYLWQFSIKGNKFISKK